MFVSLLLFLYKYEIWLWLYMESYVLPIKEYDVLRLWWRVFFFWKDGEFKTLNIDWNLNSITIYIYIYIYGTIL